MATSLKPLIPLAMSTTWPPFRSRSYCCPWAIAQVAKTRARKMEAVRRFMGLTPFIRGVGALWDNDGASFPPRTDKYRFLPAALDAVSYVSLHGRKDASPADEQMLRAVSRRAARQLLRKIDTHELTGSGKTRGFARAVVLERRNPIFALEKSP